MPASFLSGSTGRKTWGKLGGNQPFGGRFGGSGRLDATAGPAERRPRGDPAVRSTRCDQEGPFGPPDAGSTPEIVGGGPTSCRWGLRPAGWRRRPARRVPQGAERPGVGEVSPPSHPGSLDTADSHVLGRRSVMARSEQIAESVRSRLRLATAARRSRVGRSGRQQVSPRGLRERHLPAPGDVSASCGPLVGGHRRRCRVSRAVGGSPLCLSRPQLTDVELRCAVGPPTAGTYFGWRMIARVLRMTATTCWSPRRLTSRSLDGCVRLKFLRRVSE